MFAYTPNLPALIDALPSDPGSAPGAGHTRAPHTEFTRERQVAFLDNLSVTGSVRSAAAGAGVSHQTVYRARRATGAFRTAWDAALVVARANAEAVLTCRAIDGVEEPVFYHGEAVAVRRRYCSRLLLAHLARLDRLAETPEAASLAEDFEAALGRFAAGEDLSGGADVACGQECSRGSACALRQAQGERTSECTSCREATLAQGERGCASGFGSGAGNGIAGDARGNCGLDVPGNCSFGPCNMWSMSSDAGSRGQGRETPGHSPDDACTGGEAPDSPEDWEYLDDEEEEGWGDPADYADLFAGESRAMARMPVVDRLLDAMARRRPAHAPLIPDIWGMGLLEAEQLNAFTARLEEWWLVVPPGPGDPADEWCYWEEGSPA